MTLQNNLSSLMQDYLQEKTKLASSAAQQSDTKRELGVALEGLGEERESSRETFGLSTFELMNDIDYESFERATEGLDDMTIKRYASSLHYFTVSYTNLMKQSTENPLATNQESSDDMFVDIMSQSMMLDVSKYALNEGAKVLKKVAGNANQDILDFFGRFQNALQAEQMIAENTRV